MRNAFSRAKLPASDALLLQLTRVGVMQEIIAKCALADTKLATHARRCNARTIQSASATAYTLATHARRCNARYTAVSFGVIACLQLTRVGVMQGADWRGTHPTRCLQLTRVGVMQDVIRLISSQVCACNSRA